MAAPAPNSVAALAVNSFGGDNNAPPSSCLDDPNFATICSFIQNFGEIIRIGRLPFDDLQKMLENTADVPLPLVQLHITLLRRVFKSVTHDKWERSLAKFGHTYCSQDAWEVERFGYKKAKIQTKLRLLKNLLEAQFDCNVKFKAEVNKLQAADLRLTPLGRDTEGQVYWYQVDEDANLRVYREDIDDETWEIVASNKDELEELISQLQRGEVKKPEPEETIILPEEDSNSKDDIEPKEIILDTGKVEESDGDNSSESDEVEEEKKETRTVEPLIIKQSFNLNKQQNSEVEKVQSDTDNVTYEISSSESEPKAPGIKMVLGVKSKLKSDNSPEASSIEVKSCNVEETKVSDNLIKNESPANILSSDVAPAELSSGVVPKAENLEDNVKEKVEIPEVLVETPVQKQESLPVEVKATKFSGIFSSEVAPKVDQRELQAKVNKNRQKSAKVNSIVERLNRNLPDQSGKTVADLLPPSDSSKQESNVQKEDSDIKPVIGKSTLNVSPQKDNSSSSSKRKAEALPSTKSLTENLDLQMRIQTEPKNVVEPTKKEHVSSSLSKLGLSTFSPGEKVNLIKENPQPGKDNAEVKISSITPQPIAFGQIVTTEKSVLREDTKTTASKISKISVDKRGTGHDSAGSLKPKETGASLEGQMMPMEVDEPCPPESLTPVVEEIQTKKEAWICGKKETPAEELVVKEKVWLCGASEHKNIDAEIHKPEVRAESLQQKESSSEISTNKADSVVLTSNIEALSTTDVKPEASLVHPVKGHQIISSDKEYTKPDQTRTMEQRKVKCSASIKSESVSPAKRSDNMVSTKTSDSLFTTMAPEKVSSGKTPDVVSPAKVSDSMTPTKTPEIVSPVKDSGSMVSDTMSLAKMPENVPPVITAPVSESENAPVKKSFEAMPSANLHEDVLPAVTSESKSETLTSDTVHPILTSKSAPETKVADSISQAITPESLPAAISFESPPAIALSATVPAPIAPANKSPEVSSLSDNVTSEGESSAITSRNEPSAIAAVSTSSEGNMSVDKHVTGTVPEERTPKVTVENSEDLSSSMKVNDKVDPTALMHPEIVTIKEKAEESQSKEQKASDTVDANNLSSSSDVILNSPSKEVSEKDTAVDSKNEQNKDCSASYKKESSEPNSLLVNENVETKKVQLQENVPASKVNSSLVSALYSESSDSSNEGFIIDTSVGSADTSVKAQSPKQNEHNKEAVLGVAKETGETSIELKSGTKSLETIAGSNTAVPEVNNTAVKSIDFTNSITSSSSSALELNNPSSEIVNGNPNDLKETIDKPALPSTNTESMAVDAPSTVTTLVEGSGIKRKAEEEVESSSKVRKLEVPTQSQEAPIAKVPEKQFNPIVNDTVEEEVMTITGDGTGALNEGGNSHLDVPFNPICGETIEEEVMLITGVGSGNMNQGSNENSPVSLTVQETAGSQNESIESDEEESRDAFPKSRGRGGRRGRGRRGRPAGGGRNSQTSSTPRNSNRGGSRGSREVTRLGVSLDSVEVNGDNERPVRASRRIAQIRLKEEEERRKLEEERLAQLKAAQIQKKAKQEERERNKSSENDTPSVKVKKGAGRKSQKNQLQFATDYIPSASDSEEDNDDEDDGDASDEFSGKGGKRKRRRKNGKAKKGGNPWATSDEDEEEEQVEEEEEYHEVFKSDHEFSPESDLGEDEDVGPSRHARTAKQDKGDLFEEGNCCKCRKGDHPEWILLCDKCDNGWHASCLRPQLWYIPEGEWFCPPCQHNKLIENLGKNLVEYESLLKRRENEILRKQRLAYVGISLDNVLPDKEPEVAAPEAEQEERFEKEKKRQRRRILSDEELSDDFINDHSDDNMSRSRSGSSGDDSDEPVYRLRARRTKKAFDFKEYDDMINSALRVDDDEEVEEGVEIEKMDQDTNDEEDGEEKKLNGEPTEDHDGVGGGKNDAYLKHLEKQAQEEDETDEELLDEKERLRRKELKKQGQRKTRRRINDLDAYSEEEDSDDDFKASEAEDEDEELAEDNESDWSGDKMEEDSDDSIAKRARRKDRQGRHGRLGRREKYSDKGLVRRSTRKRRSRISYDESDEDEEEEDTNDKWQSDESEEEEEEESDSNSESDDATWGKKKKKGFAAAKPKLADFVLGAPSSSKGKGKGGVKRKKRKTGDDDVDRAWNSARGKKDKDEPIERRTRGRKINFKDILDSGESDDDGNVRPKRRPLSDSDDSRSPSSSRKLAEEIRAENARREKEYEEAKKAAEVAKTKSEEIITPKEVKISNSSTMPESLAISKLAESSVIPVDIPTVVKSSPPPAPVQLCVQPPHVSSPSPNSIPPISSSLSRVSSPPVVAFTMSVPASSPPVHPLSISTPPIMLPSNIASISSPGKESAIPPALPKSPPHMSFIPKTINQNSSFSPIPASISRGPVPVNMLRGPISSSMPSRLIPPSGAPMPSNLPGLPSPMNIPGGPVPPAVSIGSSPKSIPPPVPVPIIEKKPAKQPKGSRGSRGSKSEKIIPPPVLPPELELGLSKSTKTPPPVGSSSSKSSKKKDRDRDREAPVSIPNPSLLLAGAGGVLPELLGMGLPASLRAGQGITGVPPPISSSGSSSSKKSKSGSSSSRATQQTTPPPVSQNLSPSLPIDIDRVPNPALFQGNPGIRPFHPMWAVRNPGPPPPGYSPSGSPSSLGKPPPLNSSPFSGQQGPPSRPGFPSPPPLRIPNPNTTPLQNFQHFKRDGPLGGPLYRLPPGQPQPGVPLANILPPGMMSPHAGGPERFFGAPAGYPHPYGLLPPHSQGPPQALFPYDYRPPEPPFKDEPAPPRTTASSLPTPVSSASSSPPPTTSAPVPLPTKDEVSAARDSEFGGLVSYFSSQRSEEDMDT